MTDRVKEIYVGGKYVGYQVVSSTVLERPTTSKMTRGAFIDRFAGTRHAQLLEAAKVDPLLGAAKHKLDISAYVDVKDPQTILFIGYMRQIGLLTNEEAAVMLAPIGIDQIGAIP